MWYTFKPYTGRFPKGLEWQVIRKMKRFLKGILISLFFLGKGGSPITQADVETVIAPIRAFCAGKIRDLTAKIADVDRRIDLLVADLGQAFDDKSEESSPPGLQAREVANHNYFAAKHFCAANSWHLEMRFLLTAMLMMLCLAADYALAFHLFALSALSETGELTNQATFIVSMKSVITLSIPLIFKYMYCRLNNLQQTLAILCFTVLAIILSLHLGTAQVIPLTITLVEAFFTNPGAGMAEFETMLGLDPTTAVASNGLPFSEAVTARFTPDEMALALWAFRLAFLLIAFVGCLLMDSLNGLSKKRTKLKKARHFSQAGIELERLEKLRDEYVNRKAFYEDSESRIVRIAQSLLVSNYLRGLAILKNRYERFLIYVEKKDCRRNYPIFQVIRRGKIIFLTVEEAHQAIEQADQSVKNLVLMD